MDSCESLSKTFKIPISYLDYEHIEKCTNVLELEKIYLTLKSGEEGKYPHLEDFCEKRLLKLSPDSRVLRKASELLSINQLDSSTREEIMSDFQSWVNEMNTVDESLKKPTLSDNGDSEAVNCFPIRKMQHVEVEKKNNDLNLSKADSEKCSKKSCKPKDYNEWSKIADELEKQMILEEKEEASKPISTVSEAKTANPKKNIKGLSDKVDTTKMSNVEKEKAALLEKEKGNEAFKAGDLDEAVIYYTRSLSIEPISAVYNNRGLVYMKQKNWEEAIRDLSLTLKKDPSNIKALQRRASCYYEIHNLQDAITDCRKIINLSPNNKFAENHLTTCLQELEKRSKPRLKDGKRMVITEIASDDESSGEDEMKEEISKKKFVVDDSEEKERDEKQVEKEIQDFKSDFVENKSEAEFIKIKDYGNQLFKELKYEDALGVYDKLVEGWPSNPIGYRNRAACNLVLERPMKVIEDCTIAIELDKSSHLSFFRRGKAYKMINVYDKSVSDLKMALKISPNHYQIKDELKEVEALKEEEQNKCEADSALNENNFQNEMNESIIDISDSNDDNIFEEVSITKLEDRDVVHQDFSSTWEFLGHSELLDSEEKSSLDTNCLLERSKTKPMTKCEFDKELNNIRLKSDWRSTIQLLVDSEPQNLRSLIGTKLDGFILENVISSLLAYCSHNGVLTIPFIQSVLHELAKVERFCFVKMMISDHAVSELEQLFKFLKQNSKNLADIDCLQHLYQ